MGNDLQLFKDLSVQFFSYIPLLEETLLKNHQLTDLTVSEIHAIEAIGNEAPRSMSDIAQFMHITMGALTPIIDRLIKKGYVLRNHSETDRRVVLAQLTINGQKIFQEHYKVHLEIAQIMTDSLSQVEGKILRNALEKLNYYLRTYLP